MGSLAALLNHPTPWLQAGLYLFLALLLAGWVVETWRRRRAMREAPVALVVLPGGTLAAGARTEVNGKKLVIGRGEGAQLQIPSEQVALCHAAVSREAIGCRVKNLADGGVTVNGDRITRSADLNDGDLLEIGGNPFRFESARPDLEPRGRFGWLLLVMASVLFFALQRAAWEMGGASRPGEEVFLRWCGVLLGTTWIAALLLRRFRERPDPLLLPTVLVLLGLGLTTLLRTQPALYERQAMAALIGLVVLFIAAVAPLKGLAGYRFLCGIGALLLLGATVLLGREVGGQRLAISLFGLQFQPAEPAKVLIAIFLAGLLSERQDVVSRSGRRWALSWIDARYLGPVALAWVFSLALLIVQRDLGTSLLFFGLFIAFLSMASGRAVFLLAGLGAFGLGGLLSAAAFSRVRERVDLWLNPWEDPQGLGYQVCQGLFALGAGGVRGVGLGYGFPNLIPASHTDLPIAVIGEELGLLGTLALLGLYAALLLRGYRAARRSADDFSGLLAAGLTTALVLQMVVIIGGVVRALPLTGVTLPFISFGGTSLVVNLALAGALINVSGRPLQTRPTSLRRPVASWKRNLRWPVAAACGALLVLAGFLGYWQVSASAALSEHPSNARLLLLERRLNRGNIVALRGEPVATSSPAKDGYERRYPHGSLLSGVLGYSSLRHGKTGIEKEENLALLGVEDNSVIADAVERTRQGAPGYNVRLSIHLPLQQVAAAALGGRKGSVIAMDPRTGAIRALVSNPRASFDQIDEQWDTLLQDRTRPFLFRATQGVYPPGSTFKTLTSVVALDTGAVTPGRAFYCPGSASVGRYRWQCFRGKRHGRLTFTDALRVSCNCVFGFLGRKLGRDALVDGAARFGMLEPVPLEIPSAPGQVDPRNIPWNSIPIQLGFGQGPLAVTPLHMALLTAGIANDGKVMKPYLIEARETHEKRRIWERKPEVWKQATSPATARKVRSMMKRVVEAGTGGGARLPGLSAAGKTGTAENPHGPEHAWFISMAPAEKPKLVVVVLVEGGGLGGRVAAPIARKVLAAHFRIKTK